MHKLIEEILKKGFSLQISYNSKHNRFEYELDGFYKSGSVVLYEAEDGDLRAASRYQQIDVITSFYDLVALNYLWWQSSRNRYDGWANPNNMWLPFLVDEGFVKENINVVFKTYE